MNATNGILIAKLNQLEETLQNLKKYIPESYAIFEKDWGLQKIAERSLQLMIEIMIDVAERILAQKKITPQSTSSEVMKKLEEHHIVGNAEKYMKMVRFRNLIIHNYDSIDLSILYSILKNDLSDFDNFCSEILGYEKKNRH